MIQTKYAVAVGEVFDSITFFGPFDEFEDAEVWADRTSGFRNNWWIVELQDPETN